MEQFVQNVTLRGVEAGDQVGELIPERELPSRVTWPGCHGNAVPASVATRTAVSPQARARCLRSASAPSTSAWAARSPITASSRTIGTGAVSACSTSSASNTASRRKSSSSVAALTDWRAWARAASAAMLPGGGWAGRAAAPTAGSAVHRARRPARTPAGYPGCVRSLLISVGRTSLVAWAGARPVRMVSWLTLLKVRHARPGTWTMVGRPPIQTTMR